MKQVIKMVVLVLFFASIVYLIMAKKAEEDLRDQLDTLEKLGNQYDKKYDQEKRIKEIFNK